MQQYSKYLEVESNGSGKERAIEARRKLETRTPAEIFTGQPVKQVKEKKKRNRVKRDFSVYTYRGYRFVFTFSPNDEVAVLRLIPADDQNMSAKTKCPKANMYMAARRLVVILESEKELDKWQKEARELEG